MQSLGRQHLHEDIEKQKQILNVNELGYKIGTMAKGLRIVNYENIDKNQKEQNIVIKSSYLYDSYQHDIQKLKDKQFQLYKKIDTKQSAYLAVFIKIADQLLEFNQRICADNYKLQTKLQNIKLRLNPEMFNQQMSTQLIKKQDNKLLDTNIKQMQSKILILEDEKQILKQQQNQLMVKFDNLQHDQLEQTKNLEIAIHTITNQDIIIQKQNDDIKIYENQLQESKQQNIRYTDLITENQQQTQTLYSKYQQQQQFIKSEIQQNIITPIQNQVRNQHSALQQKISNLLSQIQDVQNKIGQFKQQQHNKDVNYNIVIQQSKSQYTQLLQQYQTFQQSLTSTSNDNETLNYTSQQQTIENDQLKQHILQLNQQIENQKQQFQQQLQLQSHQLNNQNEVKQNQSNNDINIQTQLQQQMNQLHNLQQQIIEKDQLLNQYQQKLNQFQNEEHQVTKKLIEVNNKYDNISPNSNQTNEQIIIVQEKLGCFLGNKNIQQIARKDNDLIQLLNEILVESCKLGQNRLEQEHILKLVNKNDTVHNNQQPFLLSNQILQDLIIQFLKDMKIAKKISCNSYKKFCQLFSQLQEITLSNSFLEHCNFNSDNYIQHLKNNYSVQKEFQFLHQLQSFCNQKQVALPKIDIQFENLTNHEQINKYFNSDNVQLNTQNYVILLLLQLILQDYQIDNNIQPKEGNQIVFPKFYNEFNFITFIQMKSEDIVIEN